ncbi:hypothetical protein GCM10022205_57950 [Spinactinospora alkalitolerans]
MYRAAEKIALSTVVIRWMLEAASLFFWQVRTHSCTWLGWISFMRILPNSGRMCLWMR